MYDSKACHHLWTPHFDSLSFEQIQIEFVKFVTFIIQKLFTFSLLLLKILIFKIISGRHLHFEC